ncbi:MAG: glutamyl-tRNA reductase [Candidatus Omnitrophica bacterium]|nr:glutamyl-tRNA reductase [Candidatus Omnitrophota bacterium]
MEILVVGLNHKTAPVEVRERLSIPSHKTGEFLRTMGERGIFNERLLLSTCNRTEIYGVEKQANGAIDAAKRFLSEYGRLDLKTLEDKLYVLRQPHSVEHLFSVASGLDSMVVGETEITGQVKDAYLFAQKNQQTGKVLNALFQRSLRVAKNLRTHTGIGAKKVSVASVAVELAEKIFGKLEKTKVLVIGTGQMSTQVVKAMVARGAQPLIVSSRHFDRARELAAELGGEAVLYAHYEHRMKDVDIIIAATEAPRLIIHEDQARRWMRERHEKPLFMIDIAVPRNIDTAVEKLDNVYLYNIDDLSGITEKNLAFRESQIENCFDLVKAQTGHYMNWLCKEFGA